MAEKVVLVLVDGMRPEAVRDCGRPFVKELTEASSYDLAARTVFPSVTLPAHMSLFHSVDPDRHGITTNIYVPQVRPVTGLFDRLAAFEKKCAMFYTWEELRDVCRPDCLHTSVLYNLHRQANTDAAITDAAIEYLKKELPDFLFLYLGQTDAVGHGSGWMSDDYVECVGRAWDCIERLFRLLPKDCSLIVTADHGGHGRGHGTDSPEDMTIPIFFYGSRFEKGKALSGVSIKDLAPTVARLLDVPPVSDWEGKARV